MLLLINRLKQDYPVFREPVKPNPHLAAVMVMLYENKGKTYIILIRRSYDLKIHAGEIAFPGGKYEKQDGDLFETARREMFEELNIWVEESLIIARLPNVTTLTGFTLTPFVAFVDHPPLCNPNSTEVNEVLDIPLVPLLATQMPNPGIKASMGMMDFRHREERIWGATAKILHQLGRLKTH